MSKSLADQLAGLGLANKKQIQKDKAEKRKQEKLARKHKIETIDESKESIEKARKEKLEKDRLLNLQRQEELKKREVIAQAKQMVLHAKLNIDDGDVKYSFADKTDNKVKSLYVTEQIQSDLARGRLAIASADDKFYVIPKNMADKIAERSDSSIIFVAQPDTTEIDEEDPYKDFVVPDDLMW
jgi:uncharacterized protein YaiL (DUF2058 family)